MKPDLMEEAVAQALYQRAGEPRPGVDPMVPWDNLEERHKRYWHEAARTAFNAMQPSLAAAEARGREEAAKECARIVNEEVDKRLAAIRRGTPSTGVHDSGDSGETD